METTKNIKCVLVGDKDVGKTCLLISYSTKQFPSEYVPNVHECCGLDFMIGRETYSSCLFDTPGEEDYDHLRSISYSETDVFLVCFSVVSPSSFENVKKKWIPEITRHCQETPFLLVGTQIDLRDDVVTVEELAKNQQKPITYEQGEKLAKELKAVKYVECSAKTREGLKNIFVDAILTALSFPRKKRHRKFLKDIPAQRAPTPYPVFRKKKTKSESEKENEIAEYCKEMLQKSMLTGVPQIVTAPTTRSKVFKTFVFLGSITGFLYQTSAFLVIYFSYPTLVDVQVTTPPYVDVPSITVCNRNGLRRSEYCRLKPNNCEPITNIPKFCSSYPIFCANGTIKGSNMFPRESAMIDEAIATQEIMEKIGHKSYPLISSCDFEDVNVTFDYCKNTTFTAFMFQDLYGKMKKCYIINARWSKSSLNLPIVPTRAVLRLILDLEPEEYFRIGRPVAGQLAIHSPWNILNPFNEGFTVKPRKTYIMQIKENIKNLLPWPYQTNCTDYIKKWEIRGRNGPLSKQMCIEECILNQTMNSCSCVLTNNLYPHNFNFCAEATDYCTKQVNYTHCFVKCSPACHSRDFEYTLREEDIELEVENHTGKKRNWNKTVELLLLFKRTQVNVYRYRAKYESIELFSFLGGFVGIWLGVSLIALLDFLESLATFIIFLVDRFKASPRISTIRSAIGSRLRSNSIFSTDDSSPWARSQVPHHNNNLRVSFDRKNSVIP